jgi:hypothetical protein
VLSCMPELHPFTTIRPLVHRCRTIASISFSSTECRHADEIFGNDKSGDGEFASGPLAVWQWPMRAQDLHRARTGVSAIFVFSGCSGNRLHVHE